MNPPAVRRLAAIFMFWAFSGMPHACKGESHEGLAPSTTSLIAELDTTHPAEQLPLRRLKQERLAAARPLITALRRRGAEVKPLWIANSISVRADASVIDWLRRQPGVAATVPDFEITAPPSARANGGRRGSFAGAARIGAQTLWDKGLTAENIVVAVVDTGADMSHPDLAAKWRGGRGSWFDPHGQHKSPHDSNGHGTQVLSVILADHGSAPPAGVAPSAKWIAARLFDDRGRSSLSVMHETLQWLLDPDGDADTDDAPHVVNLSWGIVEGSTECLPGLAGDLAVLRSAGVAIAVAAGNQGPGEDTSVSPANYDDSLAIGAVRPGGEITSFSSRGPSSCGGNIFPKLVAPGEAVAAYDLTLAGLIPGARTIASGTSLAAAHVTGGIALLRQAFPRASVKQIEEALTESAFDLGSPGADNTYGYGLISLPAAFEQLAAQMPACEDADFDGYASADDCRRERDCNDQSALVRPEGEEVRFDGIDQDCDGADLTIRISTARYCRGERTLLVQARSDRGAAAELVLDGVGPMNWLPHKGLWQARVRRARRMPEQVTVMGIEGRASVRVRPAAAGCARRWRRAAGA